MREAKNEDDVIKIWKIKKMVWKGKRVNLRTIHNREFLGEEKRKMDRQEESTGGKIRGEVHVTATINHNKLA